MGPLGPIHRDPGPPEPDPLAPGPPEASQHPVPDQVPLELADGGQDVEQEPAGGCGGVDRLVEHHQVNPQDLELPPHGH
jgi:hypothetical protein